MVKAILFDFDGVIIDSMPIKEFGFREIFRDYPKDSVEELIEFHKKNGGWSRFVKIRHFFQNILKEDVSEEMVIELAEEFSEVMKRELTDPKYIIDDTLHFLKWADGKFPMHIVSGAEHHELNYLSQELGVAHYFITIEGSPTPKSDLINNLLQEFHYKREEVILIGDSINDKEASDKNGVGFYGFNNPELKYKDRYLDSFEELKKYL